MGTATSVPAKLEHSGRSAVLIGLGIAAGTMLIRVPSVFEPRWYFDDGVFTTVAWAMSKGLPLYARVYDLQPPGIYWLYQLMLTYGGGEHPFVMQLVATLLVVASAVLTFEISRRFMSLRPAALAGALTGFVLSIPTLDGDLLNVEIAGLPFFLLSFLLAFTRRWLVIFASGVLLGLAIVMRPSFALDSLVLLIPLLGTGRKALRVMVAGAGLAAALLMIVFGLWVQGSLDAYITITVPADHLYAVGANGGTFTPLFVRLAVLAAISVAWLAMARSLRSRLIAIWLPASLAGASLTPLEFTHYVHEAIPALAFAIALVVDGFRWRWFVAPAAALALVVCAEAALILPAQQTALTQSKPPPRPFLHNIGYQNLPSYYANWLAFASGAKSESQYEQWFTDASRQDAEVALLLRLAGSSSPSLQILGNRAWIYEESGLLPATRYVAGTCSSSCNVAPEAADLHSSLSNGCADLVVAVGQLPDWQADLAAGGYVAVSGAPWPTFQSSRPHGPCART
jgi:hypothetical protein